MLHPTSSNSPPKRSLGHGVSEGLNFLNPLYRYSSAFTSSNTPVVEIKSLSSSSISPSSSPTSTLPTFPFPPISKSISTSPSACPSFSSTMPLNPNFSGPFFLFFFLSKCFEFFDSCDMAADDEFDPIELFDIDDRLPCTATVSFITLPGGSAERTRISARVPSPPP